MELVPTLSVHGDISCEGLIKTQLEVVKGVRQQQSEILEARGVRGVMRTVVRRERQERESTPIFVATALEFWLSVEEIVRYRDFFVKLSVT
jgi:hypothetical protein